MATTRKKTRTETIEEATQALIQKLYSPRELRIIRKVTAWMEDARFDRARDRGGYLDDVFDFIPGHVLVATTLSPRDNAKPALHVHTYDEILEKYEEMKEIRKEDHEANVKGSIYGLLQDVVLY